MGSKGGTLVCTYTASSISRLPKKKKREKNYKKKEKFLGKKRQYHHITPAVSTEHWPGRYF